ncbi:MAG: nickel-dependent hydrogenase large subunit, partial [Nitrospinae bacterium]|nr:nickel-dependent hydrogenase large subunit [Nitrospinota bacterium]
MAKIIISPFNRVEGDLKIKVELRDGRIFEAKASGVMFRGFEYILKGHFPEDALVYTPRICGICSISHSVAS